jgi:serine/threonine protein kinase
VTLEVLTPAYAPPEMFRHDDPSGAADVYALSASLYAVMRGRPPRWDTDRSPSLITLMDLFNQPIPELPGVPRALTEVLRWGMANDPNARPTAEQLRELLTGVRLEPGHPAGPPSSYHAPAFIPPPRPVPPFANDDTPTARFEKPRKKRRFGLFGVEDR